ncbi:MAG: DUF4906 domain-containing protein [Tidjanibacter sp.]|nr:DUF4906 domain-containing protein [Tidjanibacter sp.]
MKRYNTIILTILIVAVALLTGCTIFDDDFGNTTPDKNSAVALNFVPQNLEAQLVGTRAVDAKVTEETALNDVHIFLFNQANGEQFYYHHLSSSANEDTKSEIINPWDDDYVDIHDAIVFVVANFEEGAINKDKAEDHDYTLAELQGSYAPSNHDITHLPVMGMPMVGSVELDFDQLRDTGSVAARQVDIKMYALLSRLDFIISLNSDETDITGTYPQMTLKEFGLYNVPKYINVAESNSNSNFNESDYFDQEVTYGPTISNKSGQIRISLYMFENKQGIHTNYSYPDGIDDDDKHNAKQRYKPLIAEEENLTEKATYFTFSANYIDFHGTSIDVSYKLYVGANNTNDFNIRRNHQYKSNISIVGIKTSDYGDIDGMEGSNTFDARVTISESQPFFLSMIQERALDAHFGVVPIDIYLANSSDKVRLEVVDGVSRNMMKLHNIGRRATQEGDGKQQYFYTDMISNAASYDGLSDDISNIGNTHRVYIYVDENISLKSRTGYINVYYNGASTPSTTLAIEQTGLIPVRVVNDGNLQQVIFCESFEEYLDFYDPQQPYNSPNLFPGLPWGAQGKNISDASAQNNYIDGKKYTEMIISDYGITMSSLTLNGTPATAAAYCAHKNKRNSSNNNVVNYNWCLPGIRQLEGTLTANYNRFAPIREGKYYWSSATGKYDGWISLGRDDDNRARATAAYIMSDGTTIDYAKSDKDNKYENNEGGSALRTEKLRIRAIYQPAAGDIIDGITYSSNASTNETNFITNYPQ